MAPSIRRGIMALLGTAFLAFSIYVYTGGTHLAGTAPLSTAVQNGLRLYQAKNCVACHQIYGLGGYMGPDLTNVASAPNKDAHYLRTMIKNGTDRMPNFGLTDAEADALVAFLKFVDASGRYPPTKPVIKWYGTVDYNSGRPGK
jgi:nitric oxide reductase subunit C